MRNVAAALLLMLQFGGAAEAQESPVVVELYTSQGCSSCPPADAMMEDLARRGNVIALALHVDYWDYIGWKDEFAHPAFTQRQRQYARVAGAGTIYTPQMVIGGRDHVVGAKPMELSQAIRAAAARSSGISVTLQRNGETLHIEARATQEPGGPVVVQLVRYDPEETVSIRRGENAGRTLTYVNIVQSWQVLGQWEGGTSWVAEAQVEGSDPIVVILQQPGPGAILAAAELE